MKNLSVFFVVMLVLSLTAPAVFAEQGRMYPGQIRQLSPGQIF